MNESERRGDRPRVPVEALRKGLELLDRLSGSGSEGLSLAQLAEGMALKRSTTHNLLKTLCLCSYAENVGEGRYRPGWKAWQWSRLSRLNGDTERRIVAALGGVAAALGEAAVLAVLVDGRRRVVARADSTHAIRVDAEAVDSAYGVIWKTVTGRVLAACCDASERAVVMATAGAPTGESWSGVTTAADLAGALAGICSTGLAEQTEANVASLAVPVRSAEGRLLAALGAHLPVFRCDPARRGALLETLRLGAAELAAVLDGAVPVGRLGAGRGVGGVSAKTADYTEE